MITPRFELSQTEKTITIQIRAPYCSLKELEINVEENIFIFTCKPYYLRLHLPGQIEENDNTRSKFDADTGEFTFTYEKVIPGEEFSDLDYITKFLCPKVEVNDGNRKIEILTSTTQNDEKIETDVKYGFAMRGGYNFNYISSEFNDIFEINPHEIKLEERNKLRIQFENNAFNPDHYLADLLDGDEIQEFLNIKSPWENIKAEEIKFTPNELDFLKDLPNVDYQLSNKQINYCFNSLIEILFAYAYDRRTTFYEGTCESGWTISKLSASFSCFEGFNSPKETLICAFRRSLIYPLYREFNLSCKILEDVKAILKLGEKFLMKCLIEIYNILLKGDGNRYILNNLFVKDYITYVMKWDKSEWSKITDEVFKLKINKSDLGLGLIELECEDDLSNQIVGLSIKENEEDSDDETDSDDDTTTEDETTSSEE